MACDFEFFARKNLGEEAVAYLKKNVHPLDLAVRLAENPGIVRLNGAASTDLFLFVTGYKIGPQCFRGLKRTRCPSSRRQSSCA